MKAKTNISVRNNLGQRVISDIIIGKTGTYTSGDILDANAVVELIGGSGPSKDCYTKAEVDAMVPSDVSRTQSDATFVNKNGTALFYLRQANSTLAGLMTKNDKQKLDSLQDLSPLMPSQASAQNQLADKNFVNSSIATATSTYKGSYNLVSDLYLQVSDKDDQVAIAQQLDVLISNFDTNDYCYVQIPVSDEDPATIARIDRYKVTKNGSDYDWYYEYTLNNSGFTAAQWAAIQSGITQQLVTKLDNLPTSSTLTTRFNNKVDKTGTTDTNPMTGELYFDNNNMISNNTGIVVGVAGGKNSFGNVNSGSQIRSSVPVNRVSSTETNHLVESGTIIQIKVLTQAEYDALTTKDPNTEYNIVES